MHERIVTVPLRLDIFLANEGLALSRVKAKDMTQAGLVMVNGRVARKVAMVLKEGDKVEVSLSEEPVSETRLMAVDLKLEVIYEDDACMVINKPAGISVHPGAGMAPDEPTVLHGIVHVFKKKKIPFSSSSVLVHRLDKETTGCLLVAKNAAMHKILQKQFEDRTVKKFYLAIVAGVPDPASALIDASIGRSTANRTKMTILGSSKARDAKTTYHTLSASNDTALVSCELHTGRTHQIRVHLHAIGYPILGDSSYFTSASEKTAQHYDIHDLCLHAWKLTFVSPADDKEHAIEADPPQAFNAAMKTCGLTM